MYYYSLLSDAEKQVYNHIFDCIDRMAISVQLGKCRVNRNDVYKIFCMVLNDHPEIFWVEETFLCSTSQSQGIIHTFMPKYRMDMTHLSIKKKEVAESEKNFLDGIRFSMKPYEKVLRIYENIPRMISYDHDATVGERKKQRRTRLDDCSTIYGAFVLHKAVCGGYAKAFQYLLHKLGIQSIVVSGDTARGRHSWNLVNIENEWYHVDVTWGDLIKSFTDGYISHAWFCLPDRDVALTRTWDKDLPLPACSGNSENYYVKNKTFFLFADYKSIESCIDREIARNKYRKIQLRFASTDAMNMVWDHLISDDLIFKLYKKNNIPIKMIWHNVDSDLNVLTFWTLPDL